MSKLRSLLSKAVTKKVAFMGDEVEIRKLTIAQVEGIQVFTKTASENSEGDIFASLKKILDEGVADFKELSMEEFKEFPLEELQALSTAVTEFSGLRAPATAAEGNVLPKTS